MIWILIFVAVIIFVIASYASKKTNLKSENINNPTEKKNIGGWEIVRRKSDRWFELGFGDGDMFPGYGKLYERLFECWYVDVGSKEKKSIQNFKDVFPEHYTPNKYQKITGKTINFEKLSNSKNYIQLFSGLDNKKRIRWYFGLIEVKPTYIKTISADE